MQQSDLVERVKQSVENKQVERPPLVTVNGKNFLFINTMRMGPIMWVHFIDEMTGIHGFGGSKQSPEDKFNYQHGLLIAMGRAEKAIRLKKAKKTISHPYMA